VSVLSTATNTVTTVIHDPSFNFPFPVAVTLDGSKVYIANYVGNTVSVIATATNTVTTVTHDPSFNMPDGVAVTPDGSKGDRLSRLASSIASTWRRPSQSMPIEDKDELLHSLLDPY
jgi:YVTN family beta-propeller protein